jgi:DNA polymerase, archaea type
MVHSDSICGVWIDDAGQVHTSVATADGGRENKIESLRPFAWLNTPPAEPGMAGIQFEKLKAEGPFNWLAHAETRGSMLSPVTPARAGAWM